MKSNQMLIRAYVRMWPRQVYSLEVGNKYLESIRQALIEQPGIYVLYEDGRPYYIGQAKNLWRRIRRHAIDHNSKYYHYWTHFSAFILSDTKYINELEGLIIAASGLGIVNGPRLRIRQYVCQKIQPGHCRCHLARYKANWSGKRKCAPFTQLQVVSITKRRDTVGIPAPHRIQ